jgi:hypothetical protein
MSDVVSILVVIAFVYFSAAADVCTKQHKIMAFGSGLKPVCITSESKDQEEK